MVKLYRSELSKRQEETHKAIQFYHALAGLSRELKTSEDKKALVHHYPSIAAQIFYHFKDSQIGSLIIQQYRTHPRGELRQLALGVKNVLQARSSTEKGIERVLGMYSVSVPTTRDNYGDADELVL
ncbi:hypothetical protein J4461_03205 [Candidatus Pacearchaeota archaeon]|nr:hypothetical protein [Candidatus Pacearchaeota archaeon]